VQETRKNRLYKRNFRQGSTHPESSDITYKEGVAGSNPASSTTFFLQTTIFYRHREIAGKRFPAQLLQPE
jgi:hypothetical protein